MKAITVRDIPVEMHARLKALSKRERRSLNSELLVILGEGLAHHGLERMPTRDSTPLSRDLQISMWEELSGSWEDPRDTAEIIAEVQAGRTMGREVSL